MIKLENGSEAENVEGVAGELTITNKLSKRTGHVFTTVCQVPLQMFFSTFCELLEMITCVSQKEDCCAALPTRPHPVNMSAQQQQQQQQQLLCRLLLHKKPTIVEQTFLNLASDNPAILTVWHLRKAVPKLEVLPSITSAVPTNSVILSWIIWTLGL